MPSINVKADTMFFYPFNITLGSVHFDYMLTQPVEKTEANGKTVCYFAECKGITPNVRSAVNATVNGEIESVKKRCAELSYYRRQNR